MPIFPERKIVIFTNYRAGSTTFFTEYAKANRFVSSACLGEYFGSFFGATHQEKLEDIPFDKMFKNFSTYNKFCLKLMASHTNYNESNIEKILSKCDKIIYLYRRNFTKQALSYIGANRTNSYSLGMPEENNFTNENNTEVINVPYVSNLFVNSCISILKKNYEYMAKFYNKYPGPVYCLEDLGGNKPYNKEMIWNNKPVIPEFDVEGLFKEYGMVKKMD